MHGCKRCKHEYEPIHTKVRSKTTNQICIEPSLFCYLLSIQANKICYHITIKYEHKDKKTR